MPFLALERGVDRLSPVYRELRGRSQWWRHRVGRDARQARLTGGMSLLMMVIERRRKPDRDGRGELTDGSGVSLGTGFRQPMLCRLGMFAAVRRVQRQ